MAAASHPSGQVLQPPDDFGTLSNLHFSREFLLVHDYPYDE